MLAPALRSASPDREESARQQPRGNRPGEPPDKPGHNKAEEIKMYVSPPGPSIAAQIAERLAARARPGFPTDPADYRLPYTVERRGHEKA
jgi:hypothetical protein